MLITDCKRILVVKKNETGLRARKGEERLKQHAVIITKKMSRCKEYEHRAKTTRNLDDIEKT